MGGRGDKRHRVLSIVLGITLVLGLVGLFGLAAPSPALAAGGSLTIEGPGLNIQDPDGDGTPGVTITQEQLQGKAPLPESLQSVTGWVYLPQHDEWYSTINTWPTKNWYRGDGVKLTDLLKLAGGLKPEATLIKFHASDGFVATFTVQELLNEPRYRFPNFMNTGVQGHIPGDPSGAVPVEAIIAHRSFSTQNIEDITDDSNFSRNDANHLLYGQRAVTQQTNARFAKYTTKIQVLTDPVQKWANPTADPPPGEVPAGTKVVLHSPYDDEDKVHYTLDGSNPTIHSPMYNWIAKRWWSSRQDVLDQINKPIEITKNTVIKAFVTGPGRYDSEIVTFEYTVPPVAVTGVSIAEGDQELGVGETVQLTAVVEPENATNKAVTWSSSDEAVATVSETGLVTGVSAGTATITVKTQDGGYTDSITVTVVSQSQTVPVTGVSIAEGDRLELATGQTKQLTAVVQPENATNKAVTWSSSNESVATVDRNGLVTAVSPGTATITVRTQDGGYTDTITVMVDFVVENGVLVKYIGAGGDVVIPSNMGITEIRSEVFYNNSTITSVVIPEGVTKIGTGAFGACSKLASVDIPSTVRSIGAYAFSECPKLTEIVIPEGVTAIEEGTFWDCASLRRVTLPSTIISIGKDAFMKCPSLAEINIPASVTTIGENALRGCAITEIVIPKSVMNIGNYGIYNCANLTSVTVLSTQTTFGTGVFGKCPNVTVYGYSGSTAQTYCTANNIRFVPICIASITPVNGVEVPYGTSEAGAIAALPSQTTIVDSKGQSHTVTLNWTIAGYDGNTPGNYTATGTFELPASVVQSDPPMDLKVTATVTVLPQPTYKVTLAVEPAGGGTVTGAGEYPAGASVTVEAQAAEGYTFVNWTDAEGKEVSAAASYTFTMGTQPVTLTANFRLLEASQYAFRYELPAEIVEGQDVEVAVTFESVEVKDLGYDGVRFKFSAAGPGDVTFTAEDSNGVVHTFTNEGYWGPAGGFDLPKEYSATTHWTLNFAQAGTYTVTFSLIDADSEAVIAGLTESITVTVVPATYTVTFVVTDGEGAVEGATIEIRDAEGNVIAAEPDGTYKLVAGTYRYTVTKEGFKQAAGTFTVEDDALTVEVTLEPEVVEPERPKYDVSPAEDDIYTIGETEDGIKTMTVKAGVTGFKYFTVSIAPVTSHSGSETVVFVHSRNGSQLGLNATRADFDQVEAALAGFNVQPGDVIKVFIVDVLSNAPDRNPVILQ